MKFNYSHIFILSCILPFFYHPAYANTFTESWQGPVKANLNLYLFAADIDGTISDGPVQYDLQQPFNETIKNLDESYMMLLDVSKGRWGAYIDHQTVKVSEGKEVFNIPIAVESKLKQDSFGLYYQIYKSSDLESNVNNSSTQLGLIIEPTIGIHRTEVKAKLAALGKRAEGNTKWNEFYWGSRFKYNFDSPWNLAAELTAGVENSQDAQAYLGYRKNIFNRPVNFRVGYRYFKQDYRDHDFRWDVKEQGPVIGFNLPLF